MAEIIQYQPCSSKERRNYIKQQFGTIEQMLIEGSTLLNEGHYLYSAFNKKRTQSSLERVGDYQWYVDAAETFAKTETWNSLHGSCPNEGNKSKLRTLHQQFKAHARFAHCPSESLSYLLTVVDELEQSRAQSLKYVQSVLATTIKPSKRRELKVYQHHLKSFGQEIRKARQALLESMLVRLSMAIKSPGGTFDDILKQLIFDIRTLVPTFISHERLVKDEKNREAGKLLTSYAMPNTIRQGLNPKLFNEFCRVLLSNGNMQQLKALGGILNAGREKPLGIELAIIKKFHRQESALIIPARVLSFQKHLHRSPKWLFKAFQKVFFSLPMSSVHQLARANQQLARIEALKNNQISFADALGHDTFAENPIFKDFTVTEALLTRFDEKLNQISMNWFLRWLDGGKTQQLVALLKQDIRQQKTAINEARITILKKIASHLQRANVHLNAGSLLDLKAFAEAVVNANQKHHGVLIISEAAKTIGTACALQRADKRKEEGASLTKKLVKKTVTPQSLDNEELSEWVGSQPVLEWELSENDEVDFDVKHEQPKSVAALSAKYDKKAKQFEQKKTISAKPASKPQIKTPLITTESASQAVANAVVQLKSGDTITPTRLFVLVQHTKMLRLTQPEAAKTLAPHIQDLLALAEGRLKATLLDGKGFDEFFDDSSFLQDKFAHLLAMGQLIKELGAEKEIYMLSRLVSRCLYQFAKHCAAFEWPERDFPLLSDIVQTWGNHHQQNALQVIEEIYQKRGISVVRETCRELAECLAPDKAYRLMQQELKALDARLIKKLKEDQRVSLKTVQIKPLLAIRDKMLIEGLTDVAQLDGLLPSEKALLGIGLKKSLFNTQEYLALQARREVLNLSAESHLRGRAIKAESTPCEIFLAFESVRKNLQDTQQSNPALYQALFSSIDEAPFFNRTVDRAMTKEKVEPGFNAVMMRNSV